MNNKQTKLLEIAQQLLTMSTEVATPTPVEPVQVSNVVTMGEFIEKHEGKIGESIETLSRLLGGAVYRNQFHRYRKAKAILHDGVLYTPIAKSNAKKG